MKFTTIVKARYNKDLRRLTSVWRRHQFSGNLQEKCTTLIRYINTKGPIEAFRYTIALNQLSFLLYVYFYHIWKNYPLNDSNRVFKYLRKNYYLTDRSSLCLITCLADKLDSISYAVERMRVDEDTMYGRGSDKYIRIKIFHSSEAHKKVSISNLRKIPEIRVRYNSEFTDDYGRKYHEYFVNLNANYIANKLYKREIKDLVDLLLKE